MTANKNDRFDLDRFLHAQDNVYDHVLAELRNGSKRTHWMWFIFPQIDGLGFSATTRHFAIKSIEEARSYLSHPVLGARLRECGEAVLAVQGRSVSDIFGDPDDMKLQSSATLFAQIDEPDSIFARLLDKYFQGMQDVKTITILRNLQIGRT